MRAPRAAETLTLAVVAIGPAALAQDRDLTLPPRLDDAPYSARLAPQPEERTEALEEVLVTGENEWRLPDLGSRWRARTEAATEPARIAADVLPLYDPESPTHTRNDWFIVNEEIRRVGFIELFKVRFGKPAEE
jgi:hypothetical protein